MPTGTSVGVAPQQTQSFLSPRLQSPVGVSPGGGVQAPSPLPVTQPLMVAPGGVGATPQSDVLSPYDQTRSFGPGGGEPAGSAGKTALLENPLAYQETQASTPGATDHSVSSGGSPRIRNPLAYQETQASTPGATDLAPNTPSSLEQVRGPMDRGTTISETPGIVAPGGGGTVVTPAAGTRGVLAQGGAPEAGTMASTEGKMFVPPGEAQPSTIQRPFLSRVAEGVKRMFGGRGVQGAPEGMTSTMKRSPLDAFREGARGTLPQRADDLSARDPALAGKMIVAPGEAQPSTLQRPLLSRVAEGVKRMFGGRGAQGAPEGMPSGIQRSPMSAFASGFRGNLPQKADASSLQAPGGPAAFQAPGGPAEPQMAGGAQPRPQNRFAGVNPRDLEASGLNWSTMSPEDKREFNAMHAGELALRPEKVESYGGFQDRMMAAGEAQARARAAQNAAAPAVGHEPGKTMATVGPPGSILQERSRVAGEAYQKLRGAGYDPGVLGTSVIESIANQKMPARGTPMPQEMVTPPSTYGGTLSSSPSAAGGTSPGSSSLVVPPGGQDPSQAALSRLTSPSAAGAASSSVPGSTAPPTPSTPRQQSSPAPSTPPSTPSSTPSASSSSTPSGGTSSGASTSSTGTPARPMTSEASSGKSLSFMTPVGSGMIMVSPGSMGLYKGPLGEMFTSGGNFVSTLRAGNLAVPSLKTGAEKTAQEAARKQRVENSKAGTASGAPVSSSGGSASSSGAPGTPAGTTPATTPETGVGNAGGDESINFAEPKMVGGATPQAKTGSDGAGTMGKSLMCGPGFGFGFGMGKERQDNPSEFMGTPFHAKSKEIAAKEYRVKADLNDVPYGKFEIGKDGKLKDDPNRKKRDKLYTDLRKIRSDWMRLHADCLEDCAKEMREMDKTQKSLSKGSMFSLMANSDLGDISRRLNMFRQSPLYPKAAECLAQQQDVLAESRKLPAIQWKNGISFDPESKKRENLFDKQNKLKAEFFHLMADLLREWAKEHKKAMKMNKHLSFMENHHDDISKCVGLYGDGEGVYDKLAVFEDSNLYGDALECLAKEFDLEAQLKDLPRIKWARNIMVDPAKEKREKIKKELDKCKSDWLQLQGRVLRDRAKEYKKISKMNKGPTPVQSEDSKRKPLPAGKKREVTPARPEAKMQPRPYPLFLPHDVPGQGETIRKNCMAMAAELEGVMEVIQLHGK